MKKDSFGDFGENKRKDPERLTSGPDIPTASHPSTTHDFHLKLSPRGPAPEAGRTFGSYRLIRELGRGGFGRVWEAESLETARRLALKVITETQAASPEVLQRFEREGRLAASLNHPNCVYVFGAEEVDGYPVITMELMPGGTLQDLLRQRGRLPAKEAVDFILDVIEGLEAANNAGILHRDVKPSNCFLDENGKAKIGDFGLSKTLELDSNVTISGAFIGTPSYASPEQVRGREIDFRSDIYSVGATLYALLTGAPPFVAKQTGEVLARILSEEPTPFSRHRVDVPKGLQRVILRTLAKDREKRYSTYAALRAALLPFSAQGLTAGSLARRFAALLIDLAPFFSFNIWNAFRLMEGSTREMIFVSVMVSLVQFLYFFLGERYWGRTLGKFLLGLRVTTSTGSAITTRQALLRTAVFYCAMLMPGLIPLALPDLPWGTWQTNVLNLGCQAALLGTMRRRNGYAGLHEVLSGTRVNSVRAKDVIVVPEERLGGVQLAAPRHFGPYRAVLTVWDTDSESLLVAYDDILRRNVWIHRFKEDSQAPPFSQLAPVRRGRLHWLNGSRQPGNCWDAYEAPLGTSLWRWVETKGRLSWLEIRQVLLDIATELRSQLSEKENSHRKRSIHQIWVDAYGQARLLDFPVTALGSDQAVFQSTACEGWKSFMHQITLFGLQGKILRVEHLDSMIPAVPLPASVRSVIVELCREGKEPASPDAFLTQLTDVVHRPAQVTRGMRAGPQLLIALPILLVVAMAFIAPLLIPASMEDLTKARYYVVVLRGIEREPDTKETPRQTGGHSHHSGRQLCEGPGLATRPVSL